MVDIPVEPIPIATLPPDDPKKRSRVILLSVVVVLLGIFLLLFRFIPLQPSSSPSLLSKTVSSPTPFPFVEMTIPYLRARSYTSSLGQRELYSQGSSYTSYLSSYTSDGLKVNGLLTIPTGKPEDYGWPASNALRSNAGWPAIVFIHGYLSPTLYVTTERYNDYVDYLARNGFVVFKIDLRGHGESEGQAGGGYFGSDYVVDALNARAALQSADFVNKDKVGLWGHSMAGNIVMRSLAVKPEIPAAVIWAGAVYSYTDQRKYGINDQSYRPSGTPTQQNRRRSDLFQKVGSPSATSPFWREVAPTNYLADLKGAIEVHHALDDTVVNIGYSRDLVTLLDQTTVPHEFYTYPSGGHNLEGASFTLAMQRTVEFFKKYLSP